MKNYKPDAILNLEKIIGKELKQVAVSKIRDERNAFCIAPFGTITGLDIYQTALSDLSPVASLTGLTVLRLQNNKITNLSPIASLTRLTELNLRGNQITELGPLINLINLRELYLSENNIPDLGPLINLINLRVLYLDLNQITDSGPLINLTNLRELYLNSNKIRDLSALASLTSLTELSLWGNQISDLSPLASLTGLTHLYLMDNQISDLSPLAALTKLIVLDLRYNKIIDLSLLALNQLNSLSLDFNQIRDLSPLMPLLSEKKFKYLSLIPNPLESPPIEIAEQGQDAIVSYFRQLEVSKTRLLQCKLLLVGPGEVGKTTLMKKLHDPGYVFQPGTEPTTEGIQIIPRDIPCCFDNDLKENVKTFFWDFGGQEIYHATHQFFLTKRSLYILVWEARKEEESRAFDYWLNVVKLLGSGSPIIVVMNKSDVRTKNINEATLKKKFPDIQAFLKVSCLDNTGLDELNRVIQTTLGQMPHLKDLLPCKWIHIRDELKDLNENYIPASQFFDICKKHQVSTTDSFIISDYLHDLGTILFFRNDPLLADTVILKPEWATTAVYKLIDAKPIIKNNGEFQYTQLKEFWDPQSYPVSLHPQLIRLMEKFELCFNFVGSYNYFIPELMKGDPVEFDTSPYYQPGSLHFLYKYEFMPEGILSRFISRLYYLIHANRFWKYGVELAFDRSTALITSEPENNRIRVYINGTNKSQLLSIIRSHFIHIHQTLNMNPGTHYNQWIPCTCPRCAEKIEPAEPEYFAYQNLKDAFENNVNEIQCHSSYRLISIESLLNGFEPKEPRVSMLQAVIDASKHVRGLSKTMKPDEDSRNGLLCVLLSQKGFQVKDQTRWGISRTGESIGRLDAMIKSEDGTEAIIEAFKLSGFDSNYIKSHCQKIFGYDSAGLENNFMVVYCDCSNETFVTLWKKYREHIGGIEYPFPLKSLKEEDSGYAEIKIARAIHTRHEKEVGIYHVFIHMQ